MTEAEAEGETTFRYAVVALDQPRRGARTPVEEQAEEAPLPLPEDPSLGLLLHYRVPQYLQGTIEPGQLVAVPLRGQLVHGVVVEMAAASPVEPVKPLARLLDRRPVLSPAMLDLARWIAGHYRCTLWQALAPMLPPGVARRAITIVGLNPATPAGGEAGGELLEALGRRGRQVVSLLQEAPGRTLTVARLKRRYTGAASGLGGVLLDLERKGVVTRRSELPATRGRPQQERIVRLAVSAEAASRALDAASERAPLQAAALLWLLKRVGSPAKAQLLDDGWQRLGDLYLHTGATSSTVAALQRKGLVELSERPVHRKPAAATPARNDAPPPLTSAQASAWKEIERALGYHLAGGRDGTTDDGRRTTDTQSKIETLSPQSSVLSTYLLHGVTGSGKTEIYLRAIGMALRLGRQAIVLVPEISLTPQAVHRFASRFPGRVALIHSQLSPGQLFDEWRRIREGHADIVVGSRSAVFAPLPRLGLIVVDEEHEWAYKQSESHPRYHARDVALKRAELAGAVVILGSATPDLATYHQASQGEIGLLSLPTRVGWRRARDRSHLITELPMPPVQVVDMRAELRQGNHSLFSRTLQSALDATLARGEQAILYLNRRGSNSFLLCRECGHVPLCRRCDVPLVYHAAVHGLLCHRCNAFSLTFRECPKCGSSRIRGLGTGTQRVVDEVAELFPRARVLRWDRDTASRAGGHQNMMETFASGEADVLVGTQMIAKGLDIPKVTLVGVVSADTGLFLPDFRAPERSLQLLMQVAGRAGRRTETAHSRVIVQTFNPDHYAIQAAAEHDYTGFYRAEIRFRAEHGYPPYGQLARLVYSATSNERCEAEANVVARYLRRGMERLLEGDRSLPEIDVLGPAPCFVHKVRGRYRWQILLRGDNVQPLLEGFNPGSGWALDVDPMNVL